MTLFLLPEYHSDRIQSGALISVFILFLVVLMGLLVGGCQTAGATHPTPTPISGEIAVIVPPVQPPTMVPVIVVTRQIEPTPTAAVSPAGLAQPSHLTETPFPEEETAPPLLICSPLAHIGAEELPKITSNPYDPPWGNRDNGHPGVDFAFYRWRGYEAIDGHEVQAILGGRVAGIGTLRLPYGNYVLVETLYTLIPPNIIEAGFVRPGQSVYHLYAHLQAPSSLDVNDMVGCGQSLGAVGTTGASVVPHLHLEVRVGPTGVAFPQMAYYDTRAQVEEMEVYETWRLHGSFQPVDPLPIFLSP